MRETGLDIREEDYDINGDRKVDSNNLLILLEAIATGESISDFSCDGLYDDLDAFLIAVK